MKHLFFILSLLLVQSATPALAQHGNSQLEWHTDLMKANELSKASGKPIFGFFTGSDWCGWCHKLEKDVFSKPAFIKFAKEKVILLELDFPRQKQLPDALMQQNNSLQQAFQVQGYPTIWYFKMTEDPATKKMIISPWGSQGYPGGAEQGKEEIKFLNDAEGILLKGKSMESTAAPAQESKSAKTSKKKTKK